PVHLSCIRTRREGENKRRIHATLFEGKCADSPLCLLVKSDFKVRSHEFPVVVTRDEIPIMVNREDGVREESRRHELCQLGANLTNGYVAPAIAVENNPDGNCIATCSDFCPGGQVVQPSRLLIQGNTVQVVYFRQ